MATNDTSNGGFHRTADFHPTIWGDYFLKYDSQSLIVESEHYKQLKDEVKRMLAATIVALELPKALELVDAIQRLGLSYHFEEEISKILKQINTTPFDHESSLHIVSCRFRLLRQEGYPISSDVFKKFTDKEGKFKAELTSDVQGMLSLYEASHLMVNGELILEAALSFTTKHLQSSVAMSSNLNLSAFLVAQVEHALERPIRKGMPRVEAKYFISIYRRDPFHNEVLLNFASLDFNHVQKFHQMELCELTRWWKELNLESKLPYVRDRLVECYFWMMGICFEPQYALCRKILQKLSVIVLVLDDTYDVQGTIMELQALTKAIQIWNINCLDELPKYAKSVYMALLKFYDEIEESIENEERRSYQIQYAKDEMKEMCRGYLKEAEWCSENYVPTIEEYMNDLATSGQSIFSIISFIGMGDIATEEHFKWVTKYPKSIHAGSVITRLMDDIVSHKFEQKREHVASSVECYVKQHNVSDKEACNELRRQIDDAWKDINEDWIDPNRVLPMSLFTRVINYIRVVENVYKYEDSFTHSGGLMKTVITSMFVDPVPV